MMTLIQENGILLAICLLIGVATAWLTFKRTPR